MKTSKCIECPVRVAEKRVFGTRDRCGVHGRYVKLDDECSLTVGEARFVQAFMAHVVVEKTLPEVGK